MMKLSYHGVSMFFPITSEISYINQLTKPQQAPTSSIPGIQVCTSCAGAVLHAPHLTFLEFHTTVKPRYIILQKIHHLQSVLFTLKRDSLATDERLNALEEEVWLLWAASRKYNLDLHVLESKAQDAEDRPETVPSQAQKMADIVTEQWIQIQRLEQALHITQMRTMRAQRQLTRCTFLKFINNLSDDPC